MADTKPTLLLILDGWGMGPDPGNDAIAMAETPTWDKLLAEHPNTRLVTHGEAVGLVKGQMGNSEVGHLNLGAGRVVYQDLLNIKRMIANGEMDAHSGLNKFLRTCSKNSSVLHFVGLFSDGGVHSHLDHLEGMVALARRRGIKKVWIHALLDGRDTLPVCAERYFRQFSEHQPAGVSFATISGRYFAMDRDRRWDRTKLGFDAVVHGQGIRSRNWETGLGQARIRDEGDEFVTPTVLGEYQGIQAGECVLGFNFRADRMRQFVAALQLEDFDGFDRGKTPAVNFFSMRRYRGDFSNPVLLESETVRDTVVEVLSKRGLKVYKSAETEKYAHVTYFFNGGKEPPWLNETRALVQSPMVDTYDEKPEMSIYEVTDQLVQHLKQRDHNLFVVNFANGDMVGHTGDRKACIAAVEAVDHCLEQILGAIHWGKDANVVITADHGNCDQLTFPGGKISTQHSMNDVPLVVVSEAGRNLMQPNEAIGREHKCWALCDVAPTVFELMGQECPPSWTGVSLLKK